MNQQTTCPKCDHPYTIENPPKNLINCEHVICLSCLNTEILCPIDRKRLERRKYKIQSFQTNHAILDLITKKETTVESIERCEESEKISEKEAQEKIQEKESQNEEEKKQTQKEEEHCEPVCTTQQVETKKQDVYFPKYQDIVFETCLLHSKSADLICLKDKCLICSNCGLFGQHKSHSLLPYDAFVVNYTALIDQSYNNFELLKKSEEQIENEVIKAQIDTIIKEKRQSQIKYIRKEVAALIVSLKSIEKSLISQIDNNLKQKKEKLLKELNLFDLQKKIDEYYKEIEKLTQGSIDIFKLQNIQRYVDYADENNPKSYIVKEGEYLIAEVDNYSKNLKSKITEEINELQCKCCEGLSETIANSFEFISKNKPKKVEKQEIAVKVAPSRDDSSRVNSPITLKKGKEEDLLINSRSNGNKQEKHVRDMSPIQPIPKFQQTFDNTFKNSYKENIITSGKEEFFLKVNEVPFSTGALYVPQHKKAVSFANNRALTNQSTRQTETKKENQLMVPFKNHNKLSSTNSSHIVQREILSVLNENKKKKKLDIPEKYLKHYDEFCKDKVDVVDFGGAFLGDQTILAITQLFESRGKLKSAKLMNNKISDDIFPELINRCRHLSSINLSYNNLSEKSLEWLQKESQHLGSLSNITLSNNKIVLRNVKDRIENLKKKGIKISL